MIIVVSPPQTKTIPVPDVSSILVEEDSLLPGKSQSQSQSISFPSLITSKPRLSQSQSQLQLQSQSQSRLTVKQPEQRRDWSIANQFWISKRPSSSSSSSSSFPKSSTPIPLSQMALAEQSSSSKQVNQGNQVKRGNQVKQGNQGNQWRFQLEENAKMIVEGNSRGDLQSIEGECAGKS